MVTPGARSKIRKYFSVETKTDDAEQGRVELAHELRRAAASPQAHGQGHSARVCEGMELRTPDDLFASIHSGKITVIMAANRIEEILEEGSPEQLAAAAKEAEAKAAHAAAMAQGKPIMQAYAITQVAQGGKKYRRSNCGVVVRGDADLLHPGPCCNPVAGDDIVGFTAAAASRSHRASCPNVADLARHPDRMIDVEWDASGATEFRVEIVVEATDRMGLLKDVTIAIGDAGGLSAATQTSSQGIARLRFLVSISDASLLDALLATVSRVPSVYDARRLMPGGGASQHLR